MCLTHGAHGRQSQPSYSLQAIYIEKSGLIPPVMLHLVSAQHFMQLCWCGVLLVLIATSVLSRFEGALRRNSDTVNPGRAPRNVLHLCHCWYSSLQVVAFAWQEGTRAFVSLSRGFGLLVVPCLHSRHFRIRCLWTASVEHADSHPAGFPTARAFYSGGSGLLWDSDFVAC